MSKKFVNKSIDKQYRSEFNQYLPVCPICHKSRADVKLRKFYDYISCEDDWFECCGKCSDSIVEDSLL